MDSFLHSEAWERFQKAAGARTKRHDRQLYIERAVKGFPYWLSSRVAIPSNFSLPVFAKENVFLRLEPIDSDSLSHLQSFAASARLKLAPTVAVQPRQTSLVDISLPFEEILKNMKQKHRYNIRVAEKHGVQTEAYSADLSGQFERFWQLLHTTADRHDFRTHDKSYYETMTRELEKDGMLHFLFASKDGADLAALMLIIHEGTATYLHGGSVHAHKEAMAPYKLHAEAISFAKKQGCAVYDLWGTDLRFNAEKKAYEPKAGSSSAGTSRFKLGFGGTITDYPGTYDLILKPFWYTLYTIMRAARGGKRSFS